MRAQRGFVAGCVLAGTMALAASAWADTDIQGNATGLPDLDVRTGTLAPTAAQRSAASALGASAPDAARAWLSANRALFRLPSTKGFELVADNALAGSSTHAVTLRQTVSGLDASGGGLVTLGVTKAGDAWKV